MLRVYVNVDGEYTHDDTVPTTKAILKEVPNPTTFDGVIVYVCDANAAVAVPDITPLSALIVLGIYVPLKF